MLTNGEFGYLHYQGQNFCDSVTYTFQQTICVTPSNRKQELYFYVGKFFLSYDIITKEKYTVKGALGSEIIILDRVSSEIDKSYSYPNSKYTPILGGIITDFAITTSLIIRNKLFVGYGSSSWLSVSPRLSLILVVKV